MKKNNSVTNKATERISKELEKEQARLAALENKRNDIENDIKTSKSEIVRLNEQLKHEKLSIIANMVNENGVSVDDLLNAAVSGDFLSLQEKLEENQKEISDASLPAETAF